MQDHTAAVKGSRANKLDLREGVREEVGLKKGYMQDDLTCRSIVSHLYGCQSYCTDQSLGASKTGV